MSKKRKIINHILPKEKLQITTKFYKHIDGESQLFIDLIKQEKEIEERPKIIPNPYRPEKLTIMGLLEIFGSLDRVVAALGSYILAKIIIFKNDTQEKSEKVYSFFDTFKYILPARFREEFLGDISEIYNQLKDNRRSKLVIFMIMLVNVCFVILAWFSLQIR